MNPAYTTREFLHSLDLTILHYFRELSSIGSVTGTEYRAYRWLLEDALPEMLPSKGSWPTKLEVRFLPGNQLFASWRGAPASDRQIIIVAHTDHEGFLVKNAWLDSTDGPNAVWLRAEDPGGIDIETWHLEANLQIAFGADGRGPRRSGRILKIPKQTSGVRGFAAVRVETAPDENLDVLVRLVNESPWFVSAYPDFTFNSETGKGDPQRSDSLSAPYVDNGAGVAVATAVLRAVVQRDLAANVSVLYTSGEEAGFLGLLALLRDLPPELGNEFEKAVWVIVDASAHERSAQVGLEHWHRRRVRDHDDMVYKTDRCPVDVASIRLEDRCTLFDYSVALFLYQASLRVRRLLGRKHQDDKDGARWERSIGVAGTFVGGECEGTVLGRYPAVMRRLHQRADRPSLRVGALALPIVNYRTFAGYAPGAIRPEVTRIGALTSAGFVLFEACSILEDTHFPERIPTRDRSESAMESYVDENCPERKAELLGDPIDRFVEYLTLGDAQNLATPLDEWVRTEGNRLVAALPTKPRNGAASSG